jgi:hypothetical protein
MIRRRKERTMTTDTTTSTAPPAELPPGHDDPESLSYVPAELRPYWPHPDPTGDAAAWTEYGPAAYADVWWHDPENRDRAWRTHGWRNTERPPWTRLARWIGRDAYVMPERSPAADARAVHLHRLAVAATARAANLAAADRAASLAASRCPACGTPRRFGDGPGRLCPACSVVADAQHAADLAAEPVPAGGTRAAAVAAWRTRAHD